MSLLVINCGSSSVKFALFSPDETLILKGSRDRLGQSGDAKTETHREAVQEILDEVSAYPISAVGHRIVHGGPRYHTAVLINDSVIADIEAHVSDAPSHNPYALMAIDAISDALPEAPQVAMFDTAFHSRMPRRATTYAIDHDVAQKFGIRRYGFHGISHQYVASIAADFLKRPSSELRLIILHLGNGASACAVEFGHSTETSMGNTPLEGLVMGSRSGDVDAGVLLSLLRNGYSVDEVDELLNQRSGLAGLSGLGNDLRAIEAAAAEGHDRARLAINVFAHRVRKYIGAYAAAMGGLDAIVFTGGIGENSASMRGRILQRLEFLGVFLDIDRNLDAKVQKENDHALISQARSPVEVLVVKTNEELMIARHTRKLLDTETASAPRQIPIAVSARHCHLTAETFGFLFGENATPTPEYDLSQPGQFACVERVSLVGPRDRIDNVRVLGPLRSVDQVEISRTDEFRLGVDAPVRNSGQVTGSAPITLEGPSGTVRLNEGLICARRHVHMQPDDARHFGVTDGDQVAISVVGGERDLTFGDVQIRVSEQYRLEMHIDTDEANAAEIDTRAPTEEAQGKLSRTDVDASSETDASGVRTPAPDVYAPAQQAHATLGLVKS